VAPGKVYEAEQGVAGSHGHGVRGGGGSGADSGECTSLPGEGESTEKP
jgi:hypothetical protein